MSLISLTTIANVLQQAGVTKEDILAEANCNAEEAVERLSSLLGVSVKTLAPVSEGDLVQTTQGESRAAVLSQGEADTLKEAGAIARRIFG